MPIHRSQVPLLARQLCRVLPDESCSTISCALQGWQANMLPFQRDSDDHAFANQKRSISSCTDRAITPFECTVLNTRVSDSAVWATIKHVRGAKTKVIMEYHPLPEPKSDKYTTEPTNYLQLLGAVKKAESTERLKHLVQSYGATFDHVILAAAFRRLPQLATYKASDLKQAASLRLPVTSGEDASSDAAVSMSVQIPRPGARPRRSYQEAASRIALQLMAMVVGRENVRISPGTQLPGAPGNKGGKGVLWRLRGPSLQPEPESAAADTGILGMSFTPKQSAACIAALGALYVKGVPLDNKLLQATVTVALDAVAHKDFSHLQSAEARDMVLLLKGLSQLRHLNVPQKQDTIHQLTQLTASKVNSLSAGDIQTALRSFVSLGVRDDMLLDTLAARAIQLAKEFPPAGIASVLKSLALAAPQDLGYGSQQQQGSNSVNAEPMSDSSANSARQQAVEVLSAGLAPQVVLMSGQDVADMATALAELGKPLSTAQGTSLGEPARLPAWLHNLVNFLVDKATRDISKLQPSQLGAILDMLVALNTPHAGILQSVVNGILAEHQLDASLRARDAASALQALAVLAQHVSETEPDGDRPYAPKQALLQHAVAKNRNPPLVEKRETAAGLGNLPVEFSDPERVVDMAFGPLQGITSDPAVGSRQQYQRLLSEGASWHQRVAFAMERLLQLYVQPEALDGVGLAGLAKLCHVMKSVRAYNRQLQSRLQADEAQAVAALAIETVTSLILGKILPAAQQRLQDTAKQNTYLLTGTLNQGPPPELKHLLQLMQDLRSLHMISTQLSAAVALHLKSLMSQNPSAGKDLLPACIALLEECRLHNAEPTSATKEAAQLYVRLGGVQGKAAGDPWPEHTASGLAPTNNRSAKKPWDVVRPAMLAKLLTLCAANDALDATMMTLASAHVTHLLMQAQSNTSSAHLQSVADSELEWMLPACRAFSSYAGQQGNVSQPVSNAFDMLIIAIAERVRYSSPAQRQASQELYNELSSQQKGTAPGSGFGQLLGKAFGEGSVSQQALARLANALA